MGLFIVAIGIPCTMDVWEGHWEPSSVANCWTVQESLLYVWNCNKPCMCQETFMQLQSTTLFLCGEALLVADNIILFL